MGLTPYRNYILAILLKVSDKAHKIKSKLVSKVFLFQIGFYFIRK